MNIIVFVNCFSVGVDMIWIIFLIFLVLVLLLIGGCVKEGIVYDVLIDKVYDKFVDFDLGVDIGLVLF